MNVKPGCYGAASVFAHDSEVCGRCLFFDQCAQESLKTLEAIRGLINVTDILKRHDAARRRLLEPTQCGGKLEKPIAPPVNSSIKEPVIRRTAVSRVSYGVTEREAAIIATIDQKHPREAAEKLCRHGVMHIIKSELLAGRNALATNAPRYLSIAVDSLIAGGFSKREIKEAFMQKLSWTEGSAASHASIVCVILVKFNIAQEISGRIVVAPELRA